MNDVSRDRAERGTGTRFLVAAAAFVVVVAGLRAAQPIVVPFLVSAFVAVICFPPLKWLQERRVPQALALLIVICGMGALILLIVALIGSSVTDLTDRWPEYQKRVVTLKTELVNWLDERGIDVLDEAGQEGFDPRRAMQLIGTMLSGVGSVFSNGLMIVLTLIFILLEASGFPAKLSAVFGGGSGQMAKLEKIQEDVRRYVALKTMLSLCTGVLIGVWLALLGVDYPLLWGFLAFLLNYVPNIGSVIAAIPAVLLALIQPELGLAGALYAALGYVVVNGVIGNVIEPRLMGRGLGLSTLVVFLSLVFWGWVLGPFGMLLSVPLTMIVKIALENTEDLRWVAVLLSSEPPKSGSYD